MGIPSADGPAAWHAPSGEVVERVLGVSTAIVRRAVRRLLPRPVTLSVELASERLDAAAAAAGLPRGVADDGRALLVRVPAHPAAQAMIAASEGPVVAAGVPRPGGGWCTSVAEARATLEEHEIVPGGEVWGEPAPTGVGSTFVVLPASGGYRVVTPAGAVGAAEVQRLLAVNVLFVCTGNTCRSPMAEAIASDLAAQLPAGSAPVHARSAGLGAAEGEPRSELGVEALRRMGIGGSAARGRSRALTRQMIDDADVVFAMTRRHLIALQEMAPGHRGQMLLLDPDGRDVADPVGGDQALYDGTARLLAGHVARRLREFAQ